MAVGIIPAAGTATRLAPLSYPKELLPVAYVNSEGGLIPRPVLQLSLEQMHRADVRRCIVVISDWKADVIRTFGDGAALGLSLAYVIQATASGLAGAIDLAREWVGDSDVCLALPDTLIEPSDALARVRATRQESGADLVLGVFPTETPEELGPVRVDAEGQVLEVLDKPSRTDVKNTWGVAVWSSRFTALLAAEVANAGDRQPALGVVFQKAVSLAMNVRALSFAEGSFIDIGTPRGIEMALRKTLDR